MRERQAYYPAMDWLRLACAVAVLLFHLGWSSAGGGEIAALVGQGGIAVPGRDLLWRHGSVGVPIFFVISGFVIAGSAEGGDAPRFLRRRIERLYPAIFVCAPISALLWWAAGRPLGSDLVLLARSLLLLPGSAWVDPPYWTLGVEIALYLYVLLLLAGGGERLLKPGAIALAACSAALWALFLATGRAVSPPWLLPLYWGMHFSLGVLLYFARAGRLGAAGAAAAVAAGAAGAVQTMQWLTPEWTSIVPTLLWLGGLAIVGLGPEAGSAAAHPGARLAGLTTYPLYLLHFGLGLALMGWLVRAGAPPLAAMAASGLVLLLAAGAVARYAEPAVRAVLRRALDRAGLPPRAAASAAARSDARPGR